MPNTQPPNKILKKKLKDSEGKYIRAQNEKAALEKRYENNKFKIEDFKNEFVAQLLKKYDACLEITVSSEETWAELIKDLGKGIGKTLLKAGTGAAVAIGVASLAGAEKANNIVGAVGAGVGAVIGIWNENNYQKAKLKAKGFLALVEDLNLDREKIQQRFIAVADKLTERFRLQILHLSSPGIKLFANFFVNAVVKEAPNHKGAIDNLRKNFQIPTLIIKIVEIAASINAGDNLYKAIIGKISLKSIFENEWTIEGMICRSSLVVKDAKGEQYFIRDGRKGEDDQSKKYPPQIVSARLPGWSIADNVAIQDIKAFLAFDVTPQKIGEAQTNIVVAETEKLRVTNFKWQMERSPFAHPALSRPVVTVNSPARMSDTFIATLSSCKRVLADQKAGRAIPPALLTPDQVIKAMEESNRHFESHLTEFKKLVHS